MKFKDPYREGSWYKNDTISRTVIDLNYLLQFSNKNGIIQAPIPQRKFLTITDGIISGDKDGPLNPRRKETGLIIVSDDPIQNDITACYLMGFDPNKVPTIKHALNSDINTNNISEIFDIQIKSNLRNCNSLNDVIQRYNHRFVPTDGWRGHIEYQKD